MYREQLAEHWKQLQLFHGLAGARIKANPKKCIESLHFNKAKCVCIEEIHCFHSPVAEFRWATRELAYRLSVWCSRRPKWPPCIEWRVRSSSTPTTSTRRPNLLDRQSPLGSNLKFDASYAATPKQHRNNSKTSRQSTEEPRHQKEKLAVVSWSSLTSMWLAAWKAAFGFILSPPWWDNLWSCSLIKTYLRLKNEPTHNSGQNSQCKIIKTDLQISLRGHEHCDRMRPCMPHWVDSVAVHSRDTRWRY